MKIKRITTDPTLLTWKSFKAYEKEILDTLNSGKNAKFTIETEYKDIVPEVKNGRITHAWFDALVKPFYIKEIYFTILHMGDKQRTKFGIQPSLRGVNHIDKDDMGDIYFWADEKTKRGKFYQYVQSQLHEICHEYFRGTGLPDITHSYHDEHGDIKPLFVSFDWALYRPKHQAKYALLKSVLGEIITRLKRQIRPKYELPVPFVKVTQPYGVKNAIYTLTGHHIGSDLRAPLGTPVKAPCDGELIGSGTTEQLGHFLIFEMTEKYLLIPHLAAVPEMKKYKQGEVMGYIGSTGLIDGVHAHLEVWHDIPDRSKLNKNTWDKLTMDPLEFFGLGK